MLDKIAVLGIKMDSGKINRGADQAPQAIRKCGLLSSNKCFTKEIKDFGDLSIEISDKLNLDNNLEFGINNAANDFEKINEFVSSAVSNNYFPLILGGDHSISIGTISGISKHYKNLGVIWYDAHADLNTPETTITGSIYGMPLAVNLGYGYPDIIKIGGYMPKVKPENVVFIGTRELDEGEERFLIENSLKVFTIEDVQELGIEKVINDTLEYLKEKCDGIHLSFDLDSLDPKDAPGVRTPCENGLSYEDSIKALSILRDSKLITSAEFVELNPLVDVENKTAKIVINLIETLLVQ